ncbi:PREDICTED: putative F-box/LRR-repeat/kelch-repeat protein At1g11620 [Prunus mume]|uniref:F-box/LRR-repeat/kelch-repeat protein At1g11620 n=1 Tax=Prunus mume TaxID=102107 RepID=A0ABM0PRL6_PRUMU|nr:PREDICTED: putative F-box/LRR-repeat/kelch-repeat protein At1g11620 [Prunus mume]
MDILSRLSVKTLFNCRCVCKAWLSIIYDPQFTYLHASRSPFGILIETFLPPPLTKPMERFFTHLEVEACAAPGSDLQLEEITFSPGNTLPPVDAAMLEIRLINSCNGLLCFGANEGFPPVCVHPVLGEYITIPPANRNDKRLIVGLGFCIGTNVYKVFQLNNPNTEAEIYTIGAGGAWRSIGPPHYGDFNNLSFNNFLHGAVHWIPYGGRSTSSKVIQSFDFEREQFRPSSLPSLLAKN